MSEKVIVEGKFGVGDEMSDYINGTISIDENNHIRLMLLNSLVKDDKNPFAEIQRMVEFPLICGYGRNGKYYELVNCTSAGGSVNLGGLLEPKVYYLCDYLIEYPARQLKNAKVNRTSIYIDKLNQWCNNEESWKLTGYKNPFKLRFESKTVWKKKDEEIEYSLANGFKTDGDRNLSFNVDFNYSLSLKFPAKEISLDMIKEYLKEGWNFTTFLTLLTNERAMINKMLFITTNKQYSIRVYNSNFKENTERRIDNYHAMSMIGLKDIGDNLLEIYKNYKDKKKNLQVTINSIYKNAEYSKHRKVDVVEYIKQTATALEGFMRNSRNIKNEESESKWKEKMIRVTTSQTDSDAQWLNQKLKYSNEATLRKQIKLFFKEIKEKHPLVADEILDSAKMREDLNGKFVDTRNFYTHYDVGSEVEILDDATSIYLCDFITEALRIVTLEELGIKHEIIEESCRHNQALIWAKKNLKKAYLERKNG